MVNVRILQEEKVLKSERMPKECLKKSERCSKKHNSEGWT